jgi:chromate reductase
MTNGTFDVVVLVGSLRKESFNLKLAKAMQKVSPQNLKLEIVEIRDLTIYNQDLDTENPPAEWVSFRNRIRPADAVLFVTPEYNRSVPGRLKNAIDIGSRPFGKSVFQKKPAAVASLTGGALGAFGANNHLRQMLVFLDMPPLQQPEVYLGGAAKMFDAEGNFVQESTKEFIVKFLTTFASWIETTRQK